MKKLIDDYWQTAKAKDWDRVERIGASIWQNIDHALKDKQYAKEISPAIIYLIASINQLFANAKTIGAPPIPHGPLHGQSCIDGALRIVKLISLTEAVPEVKKLKKTYYKVYFGASKELINDVLSNLCMADDVASEVRQLKQRPDTNFSFTYSSLAEVLRDLKMVIMPNMLKQSENSIKAPNSIYACYVVMKEHWHAFENPLEGTYTHLSQHLQHEHPDSEFSFVVESNGQGQLNIIAKTPQVGLQHFIWRTNDNKYILMLSDDKE